MVNLTQISWAWPGPLTLPICCSKEFYSLYSQIHNSDPCCVEIKRRDNSVVWLPLLTRKLPNSDLLEAFSAHGYGGFFPGGVQLDEYEIEQLKEFLRRNKIISLFIRTHPIVEDQTHIPDKYLHLNRRTYLIDLESLPSIFSDYTQSLPQKLRWSVKHALRSGLKTCLLDKPSQDDISKFSIIYSARMKDLSAEQFYHMDEDFISDHFSTFSDSCHLMTCFSDSGEIAAACIFLLDLSNTVYYHLSATNNMYQKRQPMELLMASAIHTYSTLGYKKIFLGGGHQIDELDGLSRFKKKFSSSTHDYNIAKIITDEKSYTELRQELGITKCHLFNIGDSYSSHIEEVSSGNS